MVDDERIRKLFSKLDLSGIESWSEGDQEDMKDLISEFHHLFSLDDLELGKLIWLNILLDYRVIPLLRSDLGTYCHISMMEWINISRRCWMLVQLEGLLALGLVQWY